ncbi:MAG: 30S ribosomal protein S16 [Thermodesulfobacteriota bacterium]
MVKLRLMRLGSKKRPFYRIVAADVRAPRDGKFLDILGYYDPTKDPHVLKVDEDKIKSWVGNGAQPTNRVKKLLPELL